VAGDGLVRATRALAVALLVGCLLAGCGWFDEAPPIVDGLSVGAALDCGACDQPNTSDHCGACESIATLARRHLDETFPGHPGISSLTFHREGWYPGPSGEKILNTRSGSLVVALAVFVDGSRHAVSVYCGVGGCR
jgi:hypothetical protein